MWSLEYELTSTAPGALGQRSRHVMRSSHEQSIELMQAADGILTLRTVVTDATFEIPTAGKEGRFSLSARLISDQGTMLATDEIRIGIDHENSPPVVRSLELSGLSGDAKKPEFRLDGHSLDVTIQAQDLQSGIRTLSVGLDRDGNGKLDETESVKPMTFDDPLANQTVTRRVSIPSELLPKKPAEAEVLVQVTNGLGIASPKPNRHAVQFVQYGNLRLRFQHWAPTRPAVVTIVEKPTGRPVGSSFEAASLPVTRELMVGTYVVTLKGRRTLSRDVTILGGAPNELTLDLLSVY